MYDVLVSNEAEKFYRKQDKATKGRINKAIEAISRNPHSGPHVKRLWGEFEGKHRYALGGLRIIYDINEEKVQVKVITIRGRGDIYKR